MYKLPQRYKEELNNSFKRTMIITIAMILECPVLFVIGFYLVQFSIITPDPDFGGEKILKISFLSLSIICFISSLYLKKLNLSFKTHEEAETLLEIINKLSTFTIIIFSIGSLPAAFGFVYFLLTGNMSTFQLFIIISLITYVLCLPRMRPWEEILLYILRNKPSIIEKPSAAK